MYVSFVYVSGALIGGHQLKPTLLTEPISCDFRVTHFVAFGPRVNSRLRGFCFKFCDNASKVNLMAAWKDQV